MRNKFLVVLSQLLLFPLLVFGQGKDAAGIMAERKTMDEIIKKYGSYRPKEILTLNDEMPSSERTDIDNKYFRISYPKKCLKADLTIEESHEATINSSASLRFKPTNSCELRSPESSLVIEFDRDLSDDQASKFNAALPSSRRNVYAQHVIVNGVEGAAWAELLISRDPKTQGQPFIRWQLGLICQGKKNEKFDMFFTASGFEKIEALEKNHFTLPDEFKKTISSFKCLSTR